MKEVNSMPSPKKSRRPLCLLLVLVLIFTGTFVSSIPAGASSYESQINDLEAKQEELESKIDSLQDDIDKQEDLKAALQSRIDVVQGQIDLYNSQIDTLQNEIYQMEAEKKQIEADLQAQKDTFLARIRAMYISGSDSILTVLLGADDFADYLYQSELLASVTEYDNQIMEQMRKDITKIDRLEAAVEEEQKEILSMREKVDQKRAELGEDMRAMNSVISGLESQQSELEFDVSEYQEQIDELERKIEEAAQAAQQESVENNIQYDGSQFLWPSPGYYYISSNYGYRWGRLHKGTDIAGSNIYGTPIIAAADGVVSLVDFNDGGYGYYVMVNHGNSGGNNYTTLYAHMASWPSVSNGQSVSAGDVLGYVGSTGRSTGPHLHFEIRVNGNAQNPMNYFSSVG
jgi:murein DD-endopeptidase MepM/ murein hydrolase activator NlpD